MSTDIFVQSFTHLKDRHNADKALHMLQKVASLVKPIMRKRGWVLPVLAEFFPDNPNLLGLSKPPGLHINELSDGDIDVGMGRQILVRLRPAHSPDSFLPEEDVIGTMLHELTHNAHGPHDEKFYKYLDGLQDEYDALQRSGYAGEGFFSAGKRLGANVSHNVPPHQARLRALEAAEKRLKTSGLLGSGGRLGGGQGQGRNAGLTPRELAARAAEQRAKDEKSCLSGADAKREVAKVARETVQRTVIDLTLDDNSGSDSDVVIVKDLHPRPDAPPSNGLAGPSKVAVKPGSSKSNKTNGAPSSSSNSKRPSDPLPTHKPTIQKKLEPRQSVASEWSCLACTLVNPANALECDACHMRKPVDEDEGWPCLTCGEDGNPHQHWTCRFCGQVKLHS